MKNWKKIYFIIIGIIINVFLAIGGINAIIISFARQNELAFMTVYFYFAKHEDLLIMGLIFSGTRPNFQTFIAGIVLLGIGVVGTCIIIGKNLSFLSSKLGDKQKTILKPILIIVCIVSIIIGITTLINIQNDRVAINVLTAMLAYFIERSLIRIILLFEALKPYYSTSIIGFVMIGIGIVGLIFQLIMYEQSKIVSGMVSYKYIRPAYRAFEPSARYKIEPRRKMTMRKCPACHAPLRKKPPCECEYCGAILE
ncbi:MAG: hypothetical protein HWN67_15785 [Candidatus Helarchaeota archaeon]|nr:hypothetical protein [Candidatus Helarchaeota archaeon]